VPRLHNLTSLDIVCATYAQCYYLSAPRDTPSLEVLLCGQMLRPVPLLLSAMFYAVLTDAVAAASAVLVMLCVCGTSSRTAVRLAMPSHGRVRSVTTAPVRHCDCAVVTLAACLVACCAPLMSVAYVHNTPHRGHASVGVIVVCTLPTRETQLVLSVKGRVGRGTAMKVYVCAAHTHTARSVVQQWLLQNEVFGLVCMHRVFESV
jgi:hypothetical protein